MESFHTIYLDGQSLKIDDIINIAENNYEIDFSDQTRANILKYRDELHDRLYNYPDEPIYGTTRGCGDLKDSVLKPEAYNEYLNIWKLHKNDASNPKRIEVFRKYMETLEDYQVRYIKAHNCGTGSPLPIHITRAMMVIRLNSFAKGFSAVREETCKLIIDMLNRGVTPWVLEEGSVGASGDLVPLAMIGAVLLGLPEAKAYYKGKLLSAPDALEEAKLHPTKLGAKEAMALTNGATFMAAFMVFEYRDTASLLKNASISAALSLEAIRGEKNAFDERIATSRPHEGHTRIAEQIRKLTKGSLRMSRESQLIKFPDQETIHDDKSNNEVSNESGRIQDRYSFRAIPQVHGSVFDALNTFKNALSIEINSATDNPLFFYNEEDKKTEVLSGANFHGQPLAVIVDYLKTAVTSLSLITDKRVFSILDHALSYGLPQDLAINSKAGDTGLMIAQYAGAARAAESRVLSTPASITSITTAANQEDFVSMGSIGVQHLQKVIYNAQIVVAIEILCSFRGLQLTFDYPKNYKKLGEGTAKVFNFLKNNQHLNEVNSPPIEDRYLRTDMEAIINLVRTGELIDLVEL